MLIFTLIVLSLTTIFFVSGRIRADIVALCALLTLTIGGVLEIDEALAGFSSQVVIMMAGLFVVGGGILQTGLAAHLSRLVVRAGGNSEKLLFFLIFLTTTLIGAFVSNTGTVALMLPVVVSMAANQGISARRLLMPVAFASGIGGMLTLIGTPPNLVIQEQLIRNNFTPLTFFSFTPVGIVIILVSVGLLYPLSRLLTVRSDDEGKKKGNGKSLRQLADEYGITDRLCRFHVDEDSPAVGKTIAQLSLYQRYEVNLLEVRREKSSRNVLLRRVKQSLANANTRLKPGDIIYVVGELENVDKMASELKLERTDNSTNMDFYHIGLAEILLLKSSRFIGKRLGETNFRRKFGLNVIGIRRDKDYLMSALPNQKLRAGDVLLVQGSWKNVESLSNDEDHWVVLGQPMQQADKVTLDYKAPLAGLILILMVAAMAIESIPVSPVTAVLTAAVLMILTGCFKSVESAYQNINWESIILIAAMMPMSTALEKTGGSQMITDQLVNGMGGMGPVAVLAGIYATTSLLTMFISNTACAVLMAPIAWNASQQMGVHPYPMLFAVAVGASMCFASPFSTPPNALVMKAGRYSFVDYLRVGLPLQVIVGIVMVLVLPLIFPF